MNVATPAAGPGAAAASPSGATFRLALFAGFGTLFDLAGAVGRCADALGAKAGPLAALWQAKQFEYAWLSTLLGRRVDCWHVSAEALDHAMAVMGLADPLLRARLMQSMLSPPAFADAAAGIAAAKQAGLQIGLRSNGSITMQIAATKAAGLYQNFDALLPADRAGVFKPHPNAYAQALERFGVAAESVLYVSASAWDVAGAANAGFHAVWLNRAGASAEHRWAPPAAELSTLEDLARLLPPRDGGGSAAA